jgi:predicted amidohydrolase
VTIIAACQLAPIVGDVAGNRDRADAAVRAAAAGGARIVVLPELVDSGYVFKDRAEAVLCAEAAASSLTLRGWSDVAAELDIVIVGGWCELGASGPLFNSAAIVDRGGVRAIYRKAHLWDREKLLFTPGDSAPPVVDTPAGRIGVCICYDLEFPEWAALAAHAGADLFAAPVNWPLLPRPASERPAEMIKAQAAAAGNGVFVAVADRCGVERGVNWIGGTVIISPSGYPLTGPVLADRTATLVAEVDLHQARDKRVGAHNHLVADRRPELYRAQPGSGAGGRST